MSDTDFKVQLGAALAITETATTRLRTFIESGTPSDMELSRLIIGLRRGAGAVEKLRYKLLKEGGRDASDS